MIAFATLRVLVLLVWLVVMIATAGSARRAMFGVKRGDDALWTLILFFGLLQIGFGAKWLAGLTATPVGAGVSATSGLLVGSILIGVTALLLRYQSAGWRW